MIARYMATLASAASAAVVILSLLTVGFLFSDIRSFQEEILGDMQEFKVSLSMITVIIGYIFIVNNVIRILFSFINFMFNVIQSVIYKSYNSI